MVRLLIALMLTVTTSQAIAAGPRTKSNEAINEEQVDIKIIDSIDDPGYVYIVVDNCTVKVSKKDLQNTQSVAKVVVDKCFPERKK